MAQVRVTFTEPQCVDKVMVTVEADQLVLLHEGQRVLDVPAEAPRSADQSNGGRLARLRSEYPRHGKPWTEAKDADPISTRSMAGVGRASRVFRTGSPRPA